MTNKATRSKEFATSSSVVMSANKIFFVPYYNLFNIAVGTGFD
jgi:hypothetical protein